MPDCNEYQMVFLPECVKCVLNLSKKVQLKLQKTLMYKRDVVKDITECLKSSLESLDLLCGGHNFLCLNGKKINKSVKQTRQTNRLN